MKIQDIFFLVIFVLIASRQNIRLSAGIGLACVVLAIPLFAKWVFFTAEHLTLYAAGFFLLAVAQGIVIEIKNSHNKR